MIDSSEDQDERIKYKEMLRGLDGLAETAKEANKRNKTNIRLVYSKDIVGLVVFYFVGYYTGDGIHSKALLVGFGFKSASGLLLLTLCMPCQKILKVTLLVNFQFSV